MATNIVFRHCSIFVSWQRLRMSQITSTRVRLVRQPTNTAMKMSAPADGLNGVIGTGGATMIGISTNPPNRAAATGTDGHGFGPAG